MLGGDHSASGYGVLELGVDFVHVALKDGALVRGEGFPVGAHGFVFAGADFLFR
jgi:hypothetical protein